MNGRRHSSKALHDSGHVPYSRTVGRSGWVGGDLTNSQPGSCTNRWWQRPLAPWPWGLAPPKAGRPCLKARRMRSRVPSYLTYPAQLQPAESSNFNLEPPVRRRPNHGTFQWNGGSTATAPTKQMLANPGIPTHPCMDLVEIETEPNEGLKRAVPLGAWESWRGFWLGIFGPSLASRRRPTNRILKI